MSKFTRNAVSLGLLSVLILGLTFLLTGCGFINQDPTAKISATPDLSDNVEVGTPIDFDGSNSEDEDGNIEAYEWDFKANKTTDPATSTLENPTHTYEAAGTYTVKLIVKDDDGASDSTTVTVTVVNSAANAEFTISPYPAEVNEDVEFDPSDSTGDDIAKYVWVFEDKEDVTKSSSEKVTRSYSSAGNYEVTLTLKDSDDNFLASEGATLEVQTASSMT